MASSDDQPRVSIDAAERRTWAVQRTGWVFFALLILASVLGVFGGGPTQAVVRPFLIYVMLVLVFRLTGKRSIGEITTFDFLLLLVISEAVSSALLADDTSITGAAIAVVTLVALDVGLSLAKHRWPALDRLLEDVPVVLFHDGTLNRTRMDKERIAEDDILEAARELHGLERFDQIEKAVL